MNQKGKIQLAVNRGRNRDSESWIYSYADLITNLLAIFMMMLIMNAGKTSAFSAQPSTTQRIASQYEARISEYAGSLNLEHSSTKKLTSGSGLLDPNEKVQVLSDDQGLRVSFGGELLFPSGSSELRPESLDVLSKISSILITLPPNTSIDVEGHSDSTPTRSGRYPSNWELSSARAGSVVRALEQFGLPASRMRAIGFADTKPVNDKADLAANRRVVLRVRLQEAETQ